MVLKPAGRNLAILSLITVMVIWGSGFSVTKATVAQMPPLLFALLRFAVASVVLVGLAQARRRRPAAANTRGWPTIILMGLTGVTLYYVGFNVALLHTTASQGALIQGAIPAVTAVLAVVLLKERVSARRAGGIGISMLGVVLVVLNSAPAGDAPNPLLGAVLMLGAAFAWALYTILAKRLAHQDQLSVTAYSTVAGTSFLVPAVVFEMRETSLPTISVAGWLSVFYLGVVSSAAGYVVYNRSLAYLDASETANFLNLLPIIGVAIAVLFLGEQIVPLQLVGSALVLLGVFLTTRA